MVQVLARMMRRAWALPHCDSPRAMAALAAYGLAASVAVAEVSRVRSQVA